MHAAPEKHGPSKRPFTARTAVIALLGAAFVVAGVFLVTDTRDVGTRNGFALRQASRLSPEHPDPAAIEDWMTFEYVNRIFALPPAALRDELGIADPRYPRMSVRRYAREAGIAAQEALARVKAAVRAARSSQP